MSEINGSNGPFVKHNMAHHFQHVLVSWCCATPIQSITQMTGLVSHEWAGVETCGDFWWFL